MGQYSDGTDIDLYYAVAVVEPEENHSETF